MIRKIYCFALTQFIEIFDTCLSERRGSIIRIVPESRSSFNFHHRTLRRQHLVCRLLFAGFYPDQTAIPPRGSRLLCNLRAWRLHNHTGAFRWDPSDYTGSVLRVTQVELNSRLSPRIVRTVWLVRFVRRAWSPNCKPLRNPGGHGGFDRGHGDVPVLSRFA